MIDEYKIEKEIRSIGRRIAGLMDDKKLETGKTFNEQAEEIGIVASNLTKYKGQTNTDLQIPRMRVDSLIRIADYYGVSYDYLFGLIDTETRDPVIQDICDYTGLSKETVKKLHEGSHPTVGEISFESNISEIINILVNNSDVNFFEAVKNYLYAENVKVVEKCNFDRVTDAMADGDVKELHKVMKDVKKDSPSRLFYVKELNGYMSLESIQLNDHFWDSVLLQYIEDALQRIKKGIHLLPWEI